MLNIEIITNTMIFYLSSKFIRIILVSWRNVIRIAMVLMVNLKVLCDSLMMMIIDNRSALELTFYCLPNSGDVGAAPTETCEGPDVEEVVH